MVIAALWEVASTTQRLELRRQHSRSQTQQSQETTIRLMPVGSFKSELTIQPPSRLRSTTARSLVILATHQAVLAVSSFRPSALLINSHFVIPSLLVTL